MGMTDKQFNTHLRSLINRLAEARERQDWSAVERLELELRQALED